MDYSLDLKNFHEPSHKCLVAPIIIATGATNCQPVLEAIPHKDGLFLPIKKRTTASKAIEAVLRATEGVTIDRAQ